MEANMSFRDRAAINFARISIALLFAILPFFVSGQPLLNQKISVEMTNARLDKCLSTIEEKGHFYFAYRDEIFRPDSIVSFSAKEKSVKWILDGIFDKKMDYRVVGNHIVLSPSSVKKQKNEKVAWKVSGYLVNSRSGLPISSGTIYENSLQNSVLTDQAGAFHFDVDPSNSQISIAVRKTGFRDTVIVIKPKPDLLLTIGIEPEIPVFTSIPSQEIPPLMRAKGVETLPVIEFFIPEKQKKLALNVHIPVGEIPIQISLLPGISTNRLLCGGFENHFSLNILGGYAYSLRGMEVGGGLNILRDNMHGFQAAGGVNIVGGDVHGFQAAGGLNRVSRDVTGFQATGGANLVEGNLTGFQAAGAWNRIKGDFSGFQAAGAINFVHSEFEGFQAAGFSNHCDSSFLGFQAAGFSNFQSGAFNGFQAAGFMNNNQSSFAGFTTAGFLNRVKAQGKGAMVAGFANQAGGNFSGLQIAGFLNNAKNMKGLQIGIINIADTLKGGAIGLFSYSKHGYRAVEASYNELAPINLTLKSGTAGLYNTYSFGYRPGNDGGWMAGLGLGTKIANGRRFSFSMDGAFHYFHRMQSNFPEANFLHTFRTSLGLRMGAMELFAGPTANLWLTQTELGSAGDYFTPFSFKPTWSYDNGVTYLGGWIGIHAGIRIFNFNAPEKHKKEPRNANKKS